MKIDYFADRKISSDQFIGLLKQTSLGPRRPLENETAISGMLNNSNLTVSAWVSDRLVGVARSVTDFHYCCYLSDLAVANELQRLGIGKRLIQETLNKLEPTCSLILLAAPDAHSYYPHIGFQRHESAWIRKPNIAKENG